MLRRLIDGNAKLPISRYEALIGQMAIGESGYTTPWAMWPDEDGNLWINGNYTIHQQPGGTVSMLVTRRENGYEVDIRYGHASEFRWAPSSESGFVGGADVLPVVKVVT